MQRVLHLSTGTLRTFQPASTILGVVKKSEPPHLVIRLIPGVYQRKWIPNAVPADQLDEYAATTAAERKMKTCLCSHQSEERRGIHISASYY
jgi:hypothetical protein